MEFVVHNFSSLYNPITAKPFRSDCSYTEVMPCESLRPYIKCFWGMGTPVTNKIKETITEELIIPDTCMDIIFNVNYTENKIDSNFIGISSKAFKTAAFNNKEEINSIFAIRFYAWTASLFSEDSMSGVRNNVFHAQQHFPMLVSELEPFLYDNSTIRKRVEIAEKVLLNLLNTKRVNKTLETAIYCILGTKGNIKTASLSEQVYISKRQLERIFNEYIGVSPKQLTSLIRYQNVWNDILFNQNFHVSDAVQRYGYTDQSHFLHEFKKYHTILPYEAKRYAISSMEQNNVANLQY